MDYKQTWKKIWHFIWEEDSLASWIVNIILAFVLIKFLVYPALGLMLGTTHPVVAVVSGSMEHPGSFDDWWDSQADCEYVCSQEGYYEQYGITRTEFLKFPFKHGFNTGDIMVLIKPKDIAVGDVVVFWSNRADPIIHRVIKKENETYQTKGDHNIKSIHSFYLDEYDIHEDKLVGKAVIRIPLLGYVKIAFVWILDVVGII